MISKIRNPLPLRAVDWLLANTRRPVLVTGGAIFVPLMIIFSVTGAIYPADVEPWTDNPLEMTGLFLMMAILPAYLIMCLVGFRRLNLSNHEFILHNSEEPDQLQHILARWYRWWWLALVFGVVNIFLNVGTVNFSPSSSMFVISLCIVLGQWAMWTAVGITLFFALHEAFILHSMSAKIRFNLYDLNSLNGYGRNALNSFLMIAGALAVTMLQAIDLELRWYNYRNGLLVAACAAVILLPLPVWQIHQRIKSAKRRVLKEIDEKIRQTSTALDSEELDLMNSLLMRREMIIKLRNWPMDLSIFSRFVMYAFIVPAAWAGAALMEVFLDSALGI